MALSTDFYEIKPYPAGPGLGFVWLGTMPRGSVRVAFVFQLFVYPEHSGGIGSRMVMRHLCCPTWWERVRVEIESEINRSKALDDKSDWL